MDHRTADDVALPRLGGRQTADEMAACLARFLDAKADERTLERSRNALALWSTLTEQPRIQAVSRR